MGLFDAYARFVLGSRGSDSRTPPAVLPRPPVRDAFGVLWCAVCRVHPLEGDRIVCPCCEGPTS